MSRRDREHLDLARLRHEAHDDYHVGALSGLRERVAERSGLAGVGDECPRVGADEQDVYRCPRGLRRDGRDLKAADRAENGIDVKPAAQACDQHEDDQDRETDDDPFGPAASPDGAVHGPATRSRGCRQIH